MPCPSAPQLTDGAAVALYHNRENQTILMEGGGRDPSSRDETPNGQLR
jgi:hypothetical protein